MLSKRHVISIFVLAGLVVIALVGFGIAGIEIFFLPNHDINLLRFDSITWKNTPSEMSYETVRLRMVDDFLASHAPVGKTRDRIVALIGRPDDTEYFREYDLVYHLGPERGPFGIDSEWLVLRLDDDDIVTEARIVTD